MGGSVPAWWSCTSSNTCDPVGGGAFNSFSCQVIKYNGTVQAIKNSLNSQSMQCLPNGLMDTLIQLKFLIRLMFYQKLTGNIAFGTHGWTIALLVQYLMPVVEVVFNALSILIRQPVLFSTDVCLEV